MSRYKDMKENKEKVLFSMNIREQRQKASCACGGNCGCNGSSVKRRELQEKKTRRIAFWNVFRSNDIIDDIDMSDFKGDI